MSDVPQESTNPLQLRVQRSYLIDGVVCAIGFAAIGTWSVVVAAWNIDGSFPHPIPTAWLFGMFWGAMFFLSLYIIAASHRGKLTVTSKSIIQQGAFRSRTTAISDVISLNWCGWPVGGGIVIRDPRSRITIHLDNFVAKEREELISRLRDLIPEECQANWNVFIRTHQAIPTQPQKSRSFGMLCMVLFFTAAAVAVYCWHIRFGLPFLAVGIACGLAGLWYAFRIIRFAPDDSESTA